MTISVANQKAAEKVLETIAMNTEFRHQALLGLWENQTSFEKTTRQSRTRNYRGFNKVDSRFLSVYAKIILSGGKLNETQEQNLMMALPKYRYQIARSIA